MANRKVKYDFDPFVEAGISKRGLTDDQIQDVFDEVADFVLESVLNDVGEGVSPVTGKSFEQLSVKYAKQEGKPRKPVTLELTGDLLDSVKVIKKDNKIRLTVSEDQQPKADGHNNFTGKSKLPRRPFIPDEDKDEKLRPEIRRGIKDIINTIIEVDEAFAEEISRRTRD